MRRLHPNGSLTTEQALEEVRSGNGVHLPLTKLRDVEAEAKRRLAEVDEGLTRQLIALKR